MKSPCGIHPHKGDMLYEEKDICEACLRGITEIEGGLLLPEGWEDKYRPRLGSMMIVGSPEEMREVSEERLKPRDRSAGGFDHDCVRCVEMAVRDAETKFVGERGTCCVCAAHDCEAAREERAKHPATQQG